MVVPGGENARPERFQHAPDLGNHRLGSSGDDETGFLGVLIVLINAGQDFLNIGVACGLADDLGPGPGIGQRPGQPLGGRLGVVARREHPLGSGERAKAAAEHKAATQLFGLLLGFSHDDVL